MNAIDPWIEDASAEQRKTCGYDAKTVSFLGKKKPVASIAVDNVPGAGPART